MNNRQLVVIAAMSLGLVSLAVVDPWQRAPKKVQVDRLLSASQLDSLIKVRLLAPSGPELQIEKVDGKWVSTGTEEAEIDASAVRELTSVLGLLRSSRQDSRGVAVIPEQGAHSIQLHWSGGSQSFLFAQATAGGKHQWILPGKEGAALLVESYLIAQIVELGGQLFSRKLLRAGSPEAAVELRSVDRWLRVEGEVLAWSGRDAAPARVSEAKFRELRDALSGLAFGEALPAHARCEGAILNVHRGEERYAIHSCGPCDDEQVGLSLGKRSGCVDAALWSRVRSALAAPTSLVDRKILPAREAKAPFTLRCGKRSLFIDPAKVDGPRLAEWWSRLDGAAVDVREGAAPAIACSLSTSDSKIDFGKAGEEWVAVAEEQELLYGLGPDVESLLSVGDRDFLSLRLIEEEPLHASRVLLGEGGTQGVLQRGELANLWKSVERGDGLVAAQMTPLQASELASALVSTLSTLRAVDFADEDGLRRTGPRRKLSIEYRLPTSQGTRRYHIEAGITKVGKRCWAQVDKRPTAWVSAEVCEVLLGDLR